MSINATSGHCPDLASGATITPHDPYATCRGGQMNGARRRPRLIVAACSICLKASSGIGFLIALMMVLASSASAQVTPSNLTGVAKDAQGAVLPGVTVTANSPALIGTQSVVTEPNGTYRFPGLPSGTYSLKFELSGFQALTRAGIVLGLGQTLTIDATLQVAALQESVNVTAASPVVDVTSTAVSNVLSNEKLIGVPTSTDLWGALAQAPGVHMDGFDVGGSHKSQQTSYEAFGIGNQTRIVTEGVDTTEGQNGAGFYQDFYAQNEISVSGAGQDVTMNSPGAAVVSTIKAGGNQFKALFNQSYEPGSFVGNNSDAADTARGGGVEANQLFWETHGDVGGPVMKDKLWFYGAYNHFHVDKAIAGVPVSTATDLGIFDNATTKETYKLSSKDTLIGYYQWGRKQKPLRGLSSLRGPQSTLAQDSNSWMYNGKYQRVWSNRLFMEFNVGEFGYDFPESPSVDYTKFPPRHDLTTGVDTGAGFVQGGTFGPFDLERAKPQAFGSATYYLPTSAGSHDLKMGFEWIRDDATFGSIGSSGPILYLDSNGKPNEIRLTNLGDPAKLGSSWTIPSNKDRRVAAYFQDRWQANGYLTITGGVRFDRQTPFYTTTTTAPLLTSTFSPQTYPGADIFTRNNTAVRVGASIDPKADGRTALKVFWGRYYMNFADAFSVANPGGASFKTYQFLNTEGDGLYHGAQDLGKLIAASGGGAGTTVDPNLVTPHTDEIDISVQRQFWGESSARIAYVRKMTRNMFTGGGYSPNGAINAAWVGKFTVPVNVSVPIQSINGGITGNQNFTVYDVPDALANASAPIVETIPNGGGNWNYDTIDVAFNKRFGKGLFIDSSFDWTRADDLESPYDFTADPLQQSNPISPPDYFENPYPAVPNRQTTTFWRFQLSGRYVLPYEVGLGVNWQYQSGWNYAPIITVNLPNAGTQQFWAQNLSNNRSDNVSLLNLRIDKA